MGCNERGLCEALEAQLDTLEDALEPRRHRLHEAEAADRIALQLARVVERAIESLDKKDRVEIGTALARRLVDLIVESTAANALSPDPDGRVEALAEPLIPLLDTALLTNAPGEPRVGHQVLTEIHSANRIDLVMAFVRRSGIAPILDALRAHRQERAGCASLRLRTLRRRRRAPSTRCATSAPRFASPTT